MSDDFDESEDEVHIMIEPREEVIERLGITPEALEEALTQALDERFELIERLGEEDEMPLIDQMPVRIGDRTFRLEELADVRVSDDAGFDESE